MYNNIYLEYLWGCYVELNIFLGYMKKIFSVKMEKIKGSWNDKKKYLESYIKEKDFSNIKFEDLAPKDNIKECKEYCDSIEWGIENDKVFNIAILIKYLQKNLLITVMKCIIEVMETVYLLIKWIK